MRVVVVTYSSPILGDGVFWEGTDPNQCRNVAARWAAAESILTGEQVTVGMFTARPKCPTPTEVAEGC